MQDQTAQATPEVDEMPEVDEPEQGVESIFEPLKALEDLFLAHHKLGTVITELQRLTLNDTFKFLSKQARNHKMSQLLDLTGELDDLTKITFKQLKKIKRERPSDEFVDGMITERLEHGN